jgi:TPR repeat protein
MTARDRRIEWRPRPGIWLAVAIAGTAACATLAGCAEAPPPPPLVTVPPAVKSLVVCFSDCIDDCGGHWSGFSQRLIEDMTKGGYTVGHNYCYVRHDLNITWQGKQYNVGYPFSGRYEVTLTGPQKKVVTDETCVSPPSSQEESNAFCADQIFNKMTSSPGLAAFTAGPSAKSSPPPTAAAASENQPLATEPADLAPVPHNPADEPWRAYFVRDFVRAWSLATSAVEQGDASARTVLELLKAYRLDGERMPENRGQAEQWLQRITDRFHSGVGEETLTDRNKSGAGIRRDVAALYPLYRLSASQGSTWGELGLSSCYLLGWGVRQDQVEGIKLLKRSAERGNMQAQYLLGLDYHQGAFGLAKDDAEAAKWWKRSAQQGWANGQKAVCDLYRYGVAVTKNYVEAAKFCRLAADQGNVSAQVALASAYLNGEGVKQDDAQAAQLYLAAAERGDAWGARGFAFCLVNGRGHEKDFGAAVKWYNAAIDRGELKLSPGGLAYLYETGQGVPQSYVEAYKWTLIAAAHDNKVASDNIARMKSQMTKEQVAEAQALATAWKPAGHGEPTAPVQPASTEVALSSSVDAPAYKHDERPNDFAIVVGVESYSDKELPNATFAERDADAVAAHLLALGVPARNLRLLKGSEATGGKLRGYLDSWLPRNVKPDSRVFIYFSGHGAPNPSTGDAYLLPWDGDPALLKETAQPLSEVYASLGRLKAAAVIVALDSCFSGAGGRSVIQRGTRPLVAVRSAAALPGELTVLTAAEGDQTTGTLDAEGHGLFTYYLLDGLGKGLTSSRGLCEYVKPKVADAAARDNRTQTPSCRGDAVTF